MRILVNAISARRGGIMTYTSNLIRALAARGVDARVAVPPELHALFPDSTFASTAGRLSPSKRFAWEQVVWRSIVKRHAPDVLFSSANFGLLASPVPQILLLREGGLFDPFYLSNIAPAQDVRYAFIRSLRRRLMLMSARGADQVMVPSQAMGDLLVRWAPELSERCVVNPYGTLSGMYMPAEHPRPWGADGVVRLLYVSVYYAHKNPGILCEAVRELMAGGLQSHATITMELAEVIATPGSALDYMQMLDASRRGHLTLGAHAYSQLPTLYRGHDVFVFPSVSETFGHPMVEAMSTGMPLVAADTANNREICGDAALYFAPFSVKQLCERVRELNGSAELRATLSRNARKRVLSYYKWDDHVDRLIEMFRQVAGVRRRAPQSAGA